MKNTELRIGNKVFWNNGNGTFTRYNIDDYRDLKYSDNLSPIPLSEEWLLKFGFTKLNINHYGIGRGDDFDAYQVEFIIDEYRFYIAAYLDLPPSVTIKYVHQLQNLYFTLTDKELTLNK